MTKPSPRVLYRMKVLTNVKLHPRGKQRVFNVSTLRDLRTCEQWSGAARCLGAPLQVRYSPAEGVSALVPPPWERCLNVWLSSAKESAGFLHSLPASFASSEKNIALWNNAFSSKWESSVPWSILDIKGVGDQYFNIRHYPIWGAHIFFVVFFLTWIWRDAFILEMSEITRCSRKTSNHTHTCGKMSKKSKYFYNV